MQSNTSLLKKPEQFHLFALEKEDIWIHAPFARDIAQVGKFKDLTPELGRRVELIFPDSINVVSKVFLIALLSDLCNNFKSIEQFREVVILKADPITTRDFWNVVREHFGLEVIKPDPWYKRFAKIFQ